MPLEFVDNLDLTQFRHLQPGEFFVFKSGSQIGMKIDSQNTSDNYLDFSTNRPLRADSCTQVRKIIPSSIEDGKIIFRPKGTQ